MICTNIPLQCAPATTKCDLIRFKTYPVATVFIFICAVFLFSVNNGSAQAPPTPTGLAATISNQPDVRLTWNASAGATSYRVYRSTTSGGPFTTVVGTPATPGTAANPLVDIQIAGNTQYFYVVSAISTGGESPKSAQISVLTFPSQPLLAAVAVGTQAGNGAPRVTWAGNVGGAPGGFRVYRSTINDPQIFTAIATTVPSATSYTDVTAPNEIVCHYYVTALNTVGESRPSVTNYALAAHRRMPRLLISEILPNPSGTDSPFEWVELIATDAINFAQTPYSVVVADNGTVEEDGWIGGCGDTYGFNITAGTVARGGVVYVGGSSMAVGTGVQARSINTGTTAGDRFGNFLTTGVFGNGGGNVDAVAVFATDIRNLKPGTVPVDAIFYGTGTGDPLTPGTAVFDLGGDNEGGGGFELPINDQYNGGKLQANSPFIALDPAGGQVIRAAAGNFNPYLDRFTANRTWQIFSSGTINGSSAVTLSPLNANTPTFTGIPERFAGAVGDTTNPQLVFDVTPTSAVVAAPTSDNQTVVPNANITLTPTGTAGRYTLSITPAAAGVAFITVSATANGITTDLRLDYAASAKFDAATVARFHTFSSDASAAFALDSAHMLVADDEDQVLRIYHRGNSGAPLRVFDYTPALGLTDRTSCGGHLKEVDIEAATTITIGSTKRIFWLGTLGNEDDGDVPPNRNRLFVTDVTGNNINNYFIRFVGHYDFLRDDLIRWDQESGRTRCDGTPLPANYYGLAASAAPGQQPKEINGFAIEGLAMAPDGATAYIGFRAPFVPTTTRDRALIVPLLNINSLAGAPDDSAVFGQPIELDLSDLGIGPRGIRSIEGTASGMVIAAGSFGNVSDFALFTWNGQCLTQPERRIANLSGMNVESIVTVFPGPLSQFSAVHLLSDNGRTDWYGEGLGAKALPDGLTKFRSDLVQISLPLELQEYRLATVNAGGFPSWSFYPFLNGGGSQLYFSTTLPIDTAGLTAPAPQAVYQTVQPEFSTLHLNNLSPATAYRVRVHLCSVQFPGWENVSQNVWVSNGGSPITQFNINPYASGVFNKAMIVDLGTWLPSASGQLTVGIDPSALGKTVVINGVEVVAFTDNGGQESTVIPRAYTAIDGAGASSVLFHDLRLQNVYSSTVFPAGKVLRIRELRYRPSAIFGNAFPATTIADLQINLSTTQAAVDGLSATFADNVGADDTVVFNGSVDVSSAFSGAAGRPKDFDIVIRLSTPFRYDPAQGNLLIDYRNRSGSAATLIDAGVGNGASRVFALGANSTVAQSVDQGAEVVQLIYTVE